MTSEAVPCQEPAGGHREALPEKFVPKLFYGGHGTTGSSETKGLRLQAFCVVGETGFEPATARPPAVRRLSCGSANARLAHGELIVPSEQRRQTRGSVRLRHVMDVDHRRRDVRVAHHRLDVGERERLHGERAERMTQIV